MTDAKADIWTIEYDNDTGPDDDGFWEWWTVTDGNRSFKCDSESDANWLLAALAAQPAEPVAWQVWVPPDSGYLIDNLDDPQYVDDMTNIEGIETTPLYAAPPAPAAVPPGFVLVPREPTPEMVDAYLKANAAYWARIDQGPPKIGVWRNGTPKEATAEAYRAMIAAAGEP